MRVAVLRLRPGQDLKVSLEAWVRDNGVRAAVVLSVVGSVEHLTLRFADQANRGVLPDVGFSREVDPTWGWPELVVWPAPIL